MRRREFLGSAPVLFIGARIACAGHQSQPTPKGKDLPEELSPAEAEIVGKSAMAGDVENFFGKGFS